jgi:putative two-component system response regulator
MSFEDKADDLHFSSLMRGNIPFCVINEHLNIISTNEAFTEQIHSKLEDSEDAPVGLFNMDAVRTLLPVLADEEHQKSWHGPITVERNRKIPLVLNTMILPLDAETDAGNAVFGCFFCDETESHRSTLHGVFSSLLEASKLKDNDTGKHIERVNHYSRALAQALQEKKWPQVDELFIDNISFLASMHDVGKIGVPDDILNKPGKLEPLERKVMEEHTINGAFILNHYPDVMARDIAKAHHEWWDGSGYPYGLFGDMIPLSARIVGIADVYDALRSKRVYKPGFDQEKTLDIMKANAGRQFQPELFDVFLSIADEFDAIFKNLSDEPSA